MNIHSAFDGENTLESGKMVVMDKQSSTDDNRVDYR